jgi:hypothetical protein
VHYLNNIYKLSELKKDMFIRTEETKVTTVIAPFIKKEKILNFSITLQPSEMSNRETAPFKISGAQSFIYEVQTFTPPDPQHISMNFLYWQFG